MKRKGEDAHFSYVLRIYSQPPPEIRFAAGDVIHNLRATIDNLIWGIGQVFRAHNNLGLEFYRSETSFRDCYLPKIRKLPEPIRDWIESIQPYDGRHYIKLLNVLHHLWNRDKHRAPTLMNAAGIITTLGDSGAMIPFREMRFFHPSGLKDQQQIGTAIALWELRGDCIPKFSPLVAFDESGPVGMNIVGNPESVVDYLRHIQEYIFTQVIPKFEPYFGRQV